MAFKVLRAQAAEVTINKAPDALPGAGRVLKIRLFGVFSASIGGEPLPKMRSRKELWLLALLILRGTDRSVERSWLAGTLWPESLERAALFNLRRSLTFLRDVLGPEAERIQSPTSRSLRIDIEGIDCDVVAFDKAVKLGTEAAHAEAVALYRGALLDGCGEDWVFEHRDAKLRDVLGALEALAASASKRGDQNGAIAHLQRVLELDPLSETSLRALMETLSALGQNAAAAGYYREFRARVRRDMNTEPGAETIALFQRIERVFRDDVGNLPIRETKVSGAIPKPTPRICPPQSRGSWDETPKLSR